MSSWTMMAVIGAVALVGTLFAILIFRLEDVALVEPTVQDDERWTSII